MAPERSRAVWGCVQRVYLGSAANVTVAQYAATECPVLGDWVYGVHLCGVFVACLMWP